VRWVTVLALCALLAACGAPPSPRVVIIGLDAANWGSLTPLMEAGRLPNLSRLMSAGASGELSSLLPTVSPALWTTVATGKGMASHGVSVRVVSLEGGRGQEISSTLSSSARRVKALWEIYTDRGLRSCFLGWWATWPAEQTNGVIVSDRFLQSGERGGIHPPELERELAELGLLELHPPPGWDEYLRELADRLDRFERSPVGNAYEPREIRDLREHLAVLRNMVSLDWRVARIADRMLDAEQSWDLVGVYFWYLDVVQHLFWKYWRPEGFELPEEELGLFHDVIPRYYEFMDEVVGRLVKRLPAGTNVLIISDHGMESYYAHRYLNDLFEVEPLLEALDLLIRAQSGAVDTLRSEVLSVSSCRNLRLLSLTPRDGEMPGDRGARLHGLAATLADLRTEPSGQHLFREVVVLEEGQRVYKGDGFLAYTFEHADLLALLASRIPREDSLLTSHGWLRLEQLCPWAPEKTGFHSEGPPGVIIASGASIKQGALIEGASLLDIAPTILALAGLPAADDMEGTVLTDAVDSNHWKRFPLTTVPTYEDGRRLPRVAVPGDADDTAVLERLRALGYIP
jgi:predicted AlkP superfamily phosphohydrolase/phosphomutase